MDIVNTFINYLFNEEKNTSFKNKNKLKIHLAENKDKIYLDKMPSVDVELVQVRLQAC